MLAFLTDEDLRGAIIEGLRRHHPGVILIRAVEAGLSGKDDDEVLAWAAATSRITVSHDVPFISGALDTAATNANSAMACAVTQ